MDQSAISEQEAAPQVLPINPAEAIKQAEEDLNFLAGLCLATHMKFLFPKMFIFFWEFLKSKIHLPRAFPQIALGIPRGFAKTTFIKIFIIFIILFTNKKFIVIVSYIEDHAENIVRDVCDMLSSSNITSLFGDWKINISRDRVNCKIFSFRGRTIILGALGSKGSIRGTLIVNDRPDVMIFEDFQRKIDSENEELSNKQYEDMIGTWMKACSPFGCMFLFIANMYPTVGSILKKLKNNPDWISLIVGSIIVDEEGNKESLWEELQPLDQLIAEYLRDLRAGVPQVFLAEKLNDENAGIKAGIDITKIPKFPWDPDELPMGRAIVIDPALDNPNSDYNGIGLVGVYDGIPVLEKVKLGKFTPLQLIKEALIMGFVNGCRLVCVENVAYQASLLFWFNHVCENNHITGFQFMPLNVGSKSKNGKIAAALKELVPGVTKDYQGKEDKELKVEIYIKEEVRPFLLNEIIKWNPLKTKNQDTVLDLLTFCKMVIQQYLELMYMPYEPTMFGALKAAPLGIENNSDF